MPNAASRTRRPLWPGVPLGAAAGTLATAAAVLTSPDLYINWGSLAGMLVVIPAFAVGAAAVVTIPLAAGRWIGWMAVPLALLTSVVVGELIFQASLDTAFARRSASRHWGATERRAAAEREATMRETCRRIMAEPSIPSPPAPPGGTPTRVAPSQGSGRAETAVVLDPEHCAELLGR